VRYKCVTCTTWASVLENADQCTRSVSLLVRRDPCVRMWSSHGMQPTACIAGKTKLPDLQSRVDGLYLWDYFDVDWRRTIDCRQTCVGATVCAPRSHEFKLIYRRLGSDRRMPLQGDISAVGRSTQGRTIGDNMPVILTACGGGKPCRPCSFSSYINV
jgi:hypothetical protein